MIFLDTNILLEILLVNRPYFTQVKKFLEMAADDTAVSMLTVHLVMHFGRKQQTDDAFLHAVLNENKLITLIPENYVWAVNNEQGRDFEDALQLASAVHSGCSMFVTLDKTLAKRYARLPIKIVVPA